MSRQMHLLGFMMPNLSSHATLAWADPLDERLERLADPGYWAQIGQTLERGLFDGLFLADAPFFQDTYQGGRDLALRHAIGLPARDPVPIATLVAAATRHLGVAVTLSTQHPPYFLVRTLATLDHLSAGRAGWNIVTDFHINLARNLGLKGMLPHDERYRRADEYLEVCSGLWDSWDADAIVADRDGGVWADPAKVRTIDFEGEFFSCLGPSVVDPSPQGRPLLFQAGSSPRGRRFAAQHAEVAFSIQRTPAAMRAFATDLREQVAAGGRDPQRFRVLFGVMPVIGDSTAHAQERCAGFKQRIPIDAALSRLSTAFGIDLSDWPLDEPLAHRQVEGVQGLLDTFTTMVAGAEPTLREAALAFGVSIGMPMVVGTAAEVADQLEEFFVEGTGDGFNISVPTTPHDYERFVNQVVPQLQRRGIYPTAQRPGSFRERMLDLDPTP